MIEICKHYNLHESCDLLSMPAEQCGMWLKSCGYRCMRELLLTLSVSYLCPCESGVPSDVQWLLEMVEADL